MLTDDQLISLAKKMNVPLERVCFKDQLKQEPLQYNVGYIINLENEYDAEGNENEGSHWTCFTVRKYKNDKTEAMYFDSFGIEPPEEVKSYIGKAVPYTEIDIQSLMGNVCGFFCLAFLYWIYCYEQRSGHLYTDADTFCSLFNDLNKEIDWKHNEDMLKNFFKARDSQPLCDFREWQ